MSETVRRPGWKGLALILALTLLLGGAAGLLNREGMQRYAALTKPGFAPPGWVFPVVWTLLYAAMSVSLWLALRAGRPWQKLIVLYAVQLAVNLAWPFLFFTLGALGLAFWWLLLLGIFLCLPQPRRFYEKHRGGLKTGLVLFVLFWVCVYFIAASSGNAFLYSSF